MRFFLCVLLATIAPLAQADHCFTPRYRTTYSAPYVAPIVKVAEKQIQVVPTSTDNSIVYNYTYNITNSQLPTQQGSTIYGYPTGAQSFTSVADIYGNVDLGALYDQAIRLASDANKYGSTATVGVNALIDSAGARRAQVAEILAKGQATSQIALASAEIAKATAAANSVHIERQYTPAVEANAQASVSGYGGDSAVSSTETTELRAGLERIFRTRCVSCHGAEPKGGLDLRSIDTLSEQDAESVLDRIVHPDPAKRMPLAADYSPGTPLPMEEIKLIFAAAQSR